VLVLVLVSWCPVVEVVVGDGVLVLVLVWRPLAFDVAGSGPNDFD
jgi:hypothetical protein